MEKSGLLLATLALFVLGLMGLVIFVSQPESPPAVRSLLDPPLPPDEPADAEPEVFERHGPEVATVEVPAVPAPRPSAQRPVEVLPPVRTISITAGAAADVRLPAFDLSDLTEYQPELGLAGSIKSVGSDTMLNLMTLWGDGFQKHYPNVQVEIVGRGSSTAPPALIEGIANFGPMTRKMKEREIDAFELRYGYKPTALATAIDLLTVYVNASNPLPSLTLAQVDAIFSKSRKLNGPEDIGTWGQLGLDGDWSGRPIKVHGRDAASGTYGYFKDVALGKGEYKDSLMEKPSGSAVVRAVAADPCAIGFGPIGDKSALVRPLPLARGAADEAVEPVQAHAYDNSYPLARPLLLYVNKKPDEPLDPVRSEFVRFVFSRQGQEAVTKDGYFPVNAAVAKKMLAAVGIGLAD